MSVLMKETCPLWGLEDVTMSNIKSHKSLRGEFHDAAATLVNVWSHNNVQTGAPTVRNDHMVFQRFIIQSASVSVIYMFGRSGFIFLCFLGCVASINSPITAVFSTNVAGGPTSVGARVL